MSATTELRVRYAETDQMGVVYYANYFVWTEIARTDLMRTAGLSYDLLEKEYKLILPVIETNCRYKSSAHYDDRIEIETWPTLVRSSIIKFAYRIYRSPEQEGAERELLAESESTHVCCDALMNKRPIPEAFVAALKSMKEPA